MTTIVLETPNSLQGLSIYVRAYSPKTKKLTLTASLADAKVYKSKAGSESSARSIYLNWLNDCLDYDSTLIDVPAFFTSVIN